MTKMFRLIIFLVAILPAMSGPTVAQGTRPLIMDGKERLFQRVLMRDRVRAFDAPDGVEGDEIAPLKPLYVYARQRDWIQVGTDDKGARLFWIPAAAAVDWNQNIVVTFEGSENVGRILFFADKDSLYNVVESEDPARSAEALRVGAEEAEQGGDRAMLEIG